VSVLSMGCGSQLLIGSTIDGVTTTSNSQIPNSQILEFGNWQWGVDVVYATACSAESG
jgi:hypothetical protein